MLNHIEDKSNEPEDKMITIHNIAGPVIVHSLDMLHGIQDILNKMFSTFATLAGRLLVNIGIYKFNQRTAHQARIEAMMCRAGQSISKVPVLPSLETRLARAKLVMEEALELTEALGIGIVVFSNEPQQRPLLGITRTNYKCFPRSDIEPNLTEIAKEAADVSVVAIGTLSACGIKDNELLKLVDNNNLAKFGPGGYKDENGKWIKPPNHPKPEVKELLESQGFESGV